MAIPLQLTRLFHSVPFCFTGEGAITMIDIVTLLARNYKPGGQEILAGHRCILQSIPLLKTIAVFSYTQCMYVWHASLNRAEWNGMEGLHVCIPSSGLL